MQKYVIVDRGPEGEDPVRLLGYQRGPTGWLPLPPDAQGRLDLAPVGLSIGLEDGRPWFYDTVTGVREPDRPEWRQMLVEARERAQDAEVKIQDAESEPRMPKSEPRMPPREPQGQRPEPRPRRRHVWLWKHACAL